MNHGQKISVFSPTDKKFVEFLIVNDHAPYFRLCIVITIYLNIIFLFFVVPSVTIEDMNIAGNLAQPLLDNSHLKLRSHLAQGAVAKRRPPSKINSVVCIFRSTMQCETGFILGQICLASGPKLYVHWLSLLMNPYILLRTKWQTKLAQSKRSLAVSRFIPLTQI